MKAVFESVEGAGTSNEGVVAVEGMIPPHLWAQTFGEHLLRFAKYKVRRREIAEELVQDTFLSAWRSLSGFQGRSSFKTWLMTILKNKIVDYYEASDREREHISQPLVTNSESGDGEALYETESELSPETPEALLARRQLVERIYREIENLPEKMRKVFVSRAIEEESSPVVCEEHSISESNLFVMIYRARAKLRPCLEEK